MQNKISPLRSPFFYVGDKYKLMPQLLNFFPKNINAYIEPFVGGGSSFLNTKAKKYILNDINFYIVELHKFLSLQNENEFFQKIFESIEKYGLSCSLNDKIPPLSLRQNFKKTYFAKFNKIAYLKLRDDYNADKADLLKLYLLLIYGFNHMIRFNAKNNFNLPVGNVDFNKNVKNALLGYFDFMKKNSVKFYNQNFVEFLQNLEISKNDFVYFDPPYFISDSEYNKLWSEFNEKMLYQILDELNSKNIKWGVTNLLIHKGKTNKILENFIQKYKVFKISSNYISFNDNSIKNSVEIYATNV